MRKQQLYPERSKPMTVKACIKYGLHKLHVQLWTWLSLNPGKGKEEWPGWIDNGGCVPYAPAWCFACLAARQGRCQCPLAWPDWVPTDECAAPCLDPVSLYCRWRSAYHRGDTATATELARKIAELKWIERGQSWMCRGCRD